MTAFFANITNNENRLVTPLGSQTSIPEEFVLQFGKVTITATIDTLVIGFG